MRRILLAVYALLCVLAGAYPVPRAQPQYRAVHMLNADARTLRLAQEAGFDTVVQLFSWRQIEPTEGQYHWQYPDEVVQGAAYHGLNLVVRLDQHPQWAAAAPLGVNAPPADTADYARFVGQVAARYRGRVQAYIIWNEPNLAVDWGGGPPNPTEYVALLQAAYRAVKAADPGAIVVSAGLASTGERSDAALDDRIYLEEMYEAGAAPYFDVLGAHPYGFAYPPDDPRGAHDGLNMARISDLRDIMVKHGDARKPVWATEMGWTVDGRGQSAWQTVTEQKQAEYLAAAYAETGQQWPWLRMLSVWNLGDGQNMEWGGYDLLDASGQPRLAYRSLQALFHPRSAGLLARLVHAGRAVASSSSPQRYQILAGDSVIHLGHREYSNPWVPLYGARSPSTAWEGTVYVADGDVSAGADAGAWNLTLRVMQSNAAGNFVWVNGRRLDPAFPPDDYSNSWVALTWAVPADAIQPGPNRIRVSIGEALPLIQDRPFNWDDLQLKDMVLWWDGRLSTSAGN